MFRRRSSGFTLVELLVAVAIIGILATIAIMSYMTALHRSRQKRTMADMRTIAVAWEARAAETRSYSIAGFDFPSSNITYDEMVTALKPTYTVNVPRYDGWGHAFEFAVAGPKSYAIRSPGRDGVWEGDSYAQAETHNPDCDIVFSNGNFLRYPEVMQKD